MDLNNYVMFSQGISVKRISITVNIGWPKYPTVATILKHLTYYTTSIYRTSILSLTTINIT